jgi:hypothetical protein
MIAAKLKVSLTLSADLVALVDREAKRHRDTRNGVVAQWLRRAASASVEREITEATAACCTSLRGEERAEDEALAHALSGAPGLVSYDDVPAGGRRRGRR